MNADVNALTDRFIDAYFKEASATMRRLFDEWRIWAQYQTDELGYQGYRSVYHNALDQTLWPQRMLTGWTALAEKAETEIAGYKQTDPALYNALYDHIRTESIAFRYLLITLYGDQYSDETLRQMRKEFVTDVNRIGMNLVNSTRQNT